MGLGDSTVTVYPNDDVMLKTFGSLNSSFQ